MVCIVHLCHHFALHPLMARIMQNVTSRILNTIELIPPLSDYTNRTI